MADAVQLEFDVRVLPVGRVCVECGGPLPAGSSSRRRLCSTRCSSRVQNRSPRRKAQKVLQNRRWRARVSGGPEFVPAAPFACAECGVECRPGVDRDARASKFCGPTCVRRWHYRNGRNDRQMAAAAKLRKAARGRGPSRTWVAGYCAECGTSFVGTSNGGPYPQVFCCDRHRVRATSRTQKHRRRTAMRGGDSITHARLLERYGDRCHICTGRIDLAADRNGLWGVSIDHVVPVTKWSDESCSPHVWENVRPAHRWCNSVKNDSTSVQFLYG